MKKLQLLTKKLDAINAEIAKISFERKDTSYRRSGGYFGTTAADTANTIIIEKIARTRYLNTYVCVPLGNEAIVNELNLAKKALAKEETRLQIMANNKWAKECISAMQDFTNKQIEDGTINTNYVKVFTVGNNNIYGTHPYYKHEDYNKFVAMPNTPKHRAIAQKLNEQMAAAGLKLAS